MKNKKLTLTIGIPVFNEGKNIASLLKSIKTQKMDNFNLDKIIIVSDGSTDNTISEINKHKNSKLDLIINKQRKGLNPSQNIILKKSKSDILLIINGDVLPQGTNFLNNIVNPFYSDKKIGMVGARTKAMNKDTWIGKALKNSSDLKESIAQKYNDGDNVYLCHGQARAFSKAFYAKLNWPYNVPEDSYSYFFCKDEGFKFYYEKNAAVLFSPPSNLKDHLTQSNRFRDGIIKLESLFDSNIVKDNYKMPFLISIGFIILFIFKRPILTTGYIFMLLFIFTFIKRNYVDQSKFDISKSSKSFNHE